MSEDVVGADGGGELSFSATCRVQNRPCDWLVSKQKSNGGWGEHYSSCEVQVYVQHEKSQVVNTAWAVLALVSARYPSKTAIIKGLEVSLDSRDNLPFSSPFFNSTDKILS